MGKGGSLPCIITLLPSSATSENVLGEEKTYHKWLIVIITVHAGVGVMMWLSKVGAGQPSSSLGVAGAGFIGTG